MVVEPTVEDRLINIEHILDITNGYKPVKTIKALSYGAVLGTVNLQEALSSWKFEIDKEIQKIKNKLNEILEVINNGNKK